MSGFAHEEGLIVEPRCLEHRPQLPATDLLVAVGGAVGPAPLHQPYERRGHLATVAAVVAVVVVQGQHRGSCVCQLLRPLTVVRELRGGATLSNAHSPDLWHPTTAIEFCSCLFLLRSIKLCSGPSVAGGRGEGEERVRVSMGAAAVAHVRTCAAVIAALWAAGGGGHLRRGHRHL